MRVNALGSQRTHIVHRVREEKLRGSEQKKNTKTHQEVVVPFALSADKAL